MKKGKNIKLFGKKIDLEAHSLKFKGETVRLEPQVVQLLKVLYEKRGEVITKEALQKALWPDTLVTNDSLTKLVSKLRKALDPGLNTSAITTVSGKGYLLRQPDLPFLIKSRFKEVALYGVIGFLLYILLGSGLVAWVIEMA